MTPLPRLLRWTRRTGPSGTLPPAFMASEALIRFTKRDFFSLDTPSQQIVYGTFMRSRETFTATHNLVANGFSVQGAMLVRSLFEDMIVSHWLVLHRDDSDWLVERFQRHRDAMALHQARLQRETGWHLGRPVADASALRSKQNALAREFGGEAQKDWWDPRSNGDGTGQPLGLRGIAQRLERSATSGGMFHLRFAGGREPLLERMELVVHKWMTQFLHHTALGLPFALGPDGEPGLLSDPSETVLFVAVWIFGQQIYLLHGLDGRDLSEFNAIFRSCLLDGFGHLGVSPDLIDMPTTTEPDDRGG
jgi:Family of unknown function (DUF5677)